MSAIVSQVNNLAITDMNDFRMKSKPLEEERKFKRFTPQNATTFSPQNNNSIVIDIGPKGWLDPREVELSMEVQTVGGDNVTLATLISCIFRRIVVRDFAGTTIEDIDGYNILDRILVEAFSSADYKGNYLNTIAGYGTNLSATSWTRFSFPLHCLGLLGGGVSKYFPLKWTSGIQIEIFLEDLAQVTAVTSGTSPASDYQVRNVMLLAPIVTMSPAYDATVAQVIKENGLVFYYNSWSRSGLDLVNSTDALYNLNFPDRYLKNILVVQRLTSDIDGIADVDKTGKFAKNNLTEYQFDLNGEAYPQFPIDCQGNAPQAYNMLYKSMNLFGNASMGGINRSQYNDKTFIIGMDFETSMLNEKAVSGLDTRSVNNKVGLRLKHSTYTAAQLQAFAHVDRAIVLKENGIIERLF